MIYKAGDPQKDVSIRIKTLIIDEENPNLIAEELEKLLLRAMSDGELSENELASTLGEDATDEIELCTEATIQTAKDGCIEIVYCENEDDPQLTTSSRILFRPDAPGLVIMEKKGAINTALSYEEGKTHICTYDTPFMPFRVYVTSNRVDNRLLTDGKLKLDYILNLNDTPPQHFIITVTVKEAPEDILKNYLN